MAEEPRLGKARLTEESMVATTDQTLVPNAIAEYHGAIDAGKTEAEAWLFVVSRIRYDVLRLAIATCTAVGVRKDPSGDWAEASSACTHELKALQSSFESEPQ